MVFSKGGTRDLELGLNHVYIIAFRRSFRSKKSISAHDISSRGGTQDLRSNLVYICALGRSFSPKKKI